MAKQHPLHAVALEFISRFPGQKRYGRVATERSLAKVQAETGWEATELLWRIRQWSKTRNDLDPWQLVKPLPAAPIEQVAKPAAYPVDLSGVTEAWRRRALWIYEDYEEELP